MPTDAELIARALVYEDRAAFSVLVQRHQAAVRRFLQCLTGAGDFTLADDLAQETFLQAWQNLSRFRGESSFNTWLLGIAHNHWRNARRRKREQVTFEEINELNVESAARSSDLQHDMALALKTLSPEEQAILHLVYQEGLSHREIATLLDCPLGTVKTHLLRAKEKLRPHLSAWNP